MNRVSISSDNGCRLFGDATLLLSGPLETNLSDNLIKIGNFYITKCIWKNRLRRTAILYKDTCIQIRDVYILEKMHKKHNIISKRLLDYYCLR